MRKFLKEYLPEFVIVLLALTGAAMLAGNFGIRGIIRQGFSGPFSQTRNFFQLVFDLVINYILGFSILDFFGWVFIIGAFFFIYARVRRRYRKNFDYAATVCPRCGSPIKRRHRSRMDRLLSKTIMPDSRRYQCTNQSCGWSGLRHQRYQSGLPKSDVEVKQSS